MSVTTVRLQADVAEPLDAIAERLHRTKSWVINQALREFIARANEDASRWEQTLAALDSVAQGKVIDGEAVHAWLRTWGTDDETQAPRLS